MGGKVWLLSVAVFAAGCGAASGETDRTPALIRCFERHGGERVTRLSQLDRFPSADPQYGTGFALESISFDSLDVDTGNRDVRQALVLVEQPGLAQAGTRSHSASDGLKRARRGEIDGVTMIVMPASTDWDGPLDTCAEQVAGDQIYP